MLRFITTRGQHRTLRDARSAVGAPPIELTHYDRLFAARRLQRATTIFTDFDRMSDWDLELAARCYRRLDDEGVPVLNDPARFKTRYALLRSLHEAGINDFNAYRIDEGVKPARYPVFLRRESGHGHPIWRLHESWDGVAQAIDAALARGIPESNLIVVEYCAEPLRPGVFRKLAVARVGDTLVPQLAVHDEQWLVKYGKEGAADQALYEEEQRIARERPYDEILMRAFEIAHADYGRADFGLVGGRPQVYEINSNPSVRPGRAQPSPVRRESQQHVWSCFLDALQRLDARMEKKGSIRVEDQRLRRYQGLRGLGIRSRFVP